VKKKGGEVEGEGPYIYWGSNEKDSKAGDAQEARRSLSGSFRKRKEINDTRGIKAELLKEDFSGWTMRKGARSLRRGKKNPSGKF